MDEDIVKGLGRLRTAMLVYIAMYVIALISFSITIAYPTVGGPFLMSFVYIILALTYSTLGGPFLMFSVYIILALASFFIAIFLIMASLLRSGFKTIKAKNKMVGIGATGALLQIIGGAIILLLIILIAVALTQINPPVRSWGAAQTALFVGGSILFVIGLIVGALIFAAGMILTLVGFWRIGGVYGKDLIKVGAILFIFTGIISLIGALLIYLGMGEAQDIEKKSKGTKTA